MDETIKKVAVAMCYADQRMPYEAVELRIDGPTPTALVVRSGMRWEMYEPEARRLLAGLRALTE